MRQLVVILFLSFSAISFAQLNMVPKLKTDFEIAIVTKNKAKIEELANELVGAYSSTIYIYYNSVLAQLPKESILVTNGVEDLFPLLILQTIKKVNPTVDIVSLKLMNTHFDYANSVLKTYKLNTGFDKTSESIYLSRLLQQKKTKIFLSVTIPNSTYKNHQASLFLIGSALEYKSTTQYNQLLKFYKSNASFLNNIPVLTEGEKQLLSNYLPALLTLFKMQVQIGEVDGELKGNILALAKSSGKKDRVERILNTYNK
jgi:hypothetical protein